MTRGIGGFLAELRRRHVIRVLLAYLAAAWLLIQVLETLFPIFGLPETSIQVVVVVLAIGTVPAAILSWVFEWTPTGLQRDTDVVEPGRRRQNTRNLDRIIIVILTIALAFFAIDEFVFDARSDAEWREAAERAAAFSETLSTHRASVAVLPLRSVSQQPEHVHFADGLSEEVLNSLAAIADLKVSSRSSAFAVADKALPISEIAEILGVDHVLEGSVRRTGDQVRVTARLVDARSDTQVWSESYDRQLTVDNVFNIQAEIAAQVVGALDVALSASVGETVARGPADLRALDHYHDGLYLLHQLSPYDDNFMQLYEQARGSFEAAISIDPAWAPPRGMLGTLYHKVKPDSETSDAWLATSERYLSQALELDPGFAPAHGSMAYLRTVKGDYAGALRQYDRAIALGNKEAHWGKALTLRVVAQHDAAIEQFLAAAAVDPLHEVGRFQLFETYYCAGRFAQSIDGLTNYTRIGPNDIYARILLATAHAHLGNADTALAEADAIAAKIGDEMPLATVFALAGEKERALAALAGANARQPFIAVDIVPAAVLLGDPERAITLLEAIVDVVEEEFRRADQYGWLFRLQCSPVIRELAGQPRYEQLLFRLGLPS